MDQLTTAFSPFMKDPGEAENALAELGVAPSFPVNACYFSARVKTFAAGNNMPTILDLCTMKNALALVGSSIRLKNFGDGSLAEIARFHEAVFLRDRSSLQAVLPLSAKRGGIDLGVAANRAASKTTLGIEGLTTRLVEAETLETVGVEKKVTRERVRQVALSFTKSMQAVLDGVPDEKSRLWDEWRRTGQVTTVVTEESSPIHTLACAAVRAIFATSTEGQTFRHEQFRRAEEVARQIKRDPALYQEGLNLTLFLEQKAPDMTPHYFVAWNSVEELFDVSTTNQLRILEPKAIDVVAALVSNGIVRPKPILDFLMQVPGIRSWPAAGIRTNFENWRKQPGFPQVELLDDIPAPSPAVSPTSSTHYSASDLIDFVRAAGRLQLKSFATELDFTAEIHVSGLVFVTGSDTDRRCDEPTLAQHLELYRLTRSTVTTDYSKRGLFHSTYFIALATTYEASISHESIAARELRQIEETPATERTAVFLSRVGQGRFRDDLIENRARCYVTALDDTRFLRASHIVPWRDCDNIKRLDWHNGLLLSPNYDHLFDRGLISFRDDGSILISPQIPSDVLRQFGIKPDYVGEPFCEATKRYMAIHREKYFQWK
jgi:hypothetical protein